MSKKIKLYSIVDKDGNKSIVNTDLVANDGFVPVWDHIGGHSEAFIDYIKECETIDDVDYINTYKKLYDIE